MKSILFAFLLATSVFADTYMQNPRGSNDRLNEANTNRNNANRLFDSQNNAKGGYCLGPAMSFYEGSFLAIQWTNQHGCGNPKLFCNFVLQYMCTSNKANPMIRVRDGTTTDTIPDDPTGPTTTDANGELQFGMHESYQYYQDCKARNRNKGLYIADREEEGGLNDGRASSIFTRQNNNGDRHGYECTEERDYYPYWASSPWVDIAILTPDLSLCDFYKAESQNVKSRFRCKDAKTGEQAAPNNEKECKTSGNNWVDDNSAFGVAPPDCQKTLFTRDNHLGSPAATDMSDDNAYNWTLPFAKDIPCVAAGDCACTLRLRYNISSGDFGANGNNPQQGFIDSTSNANASPIKDDEIVPTAEGQLVQMAMDTTQFFRTFQDRSHVFTIIARPPTIPASNRIFNLNVRGKRGNIVQTYPATEYDFVPKQLSVRVGDYIHFQWTGCDTNPAGNAGEGTDQTDRHNMVQVENFGSSIPAKDDFFKNHTPLFDTPELRFLMAYLGQTNCLTQDQLLAKNNNNENQAKQDVQNCMKLNAAPQYFNAGAIRMNNTGEFFYISTRNNNFSNRDQKAAIFTETLLPIWGIVVVSVGAAVFVASGATAGAMFYARTHPHSGVAQIVNKF
jgi:hypothetical protein